MEYGLRVMFNNDLDSLLHLRIVACAYKLKGIIFILGNTYANITFLMVCMIKVWRLLYTTLYQRINTQHPLINRLIHHPVAPSPHPSRVSAEVQESSNSKFRSLQELGREHKKEEEYA